MTRTIRTALLALSAATALALTGCSDGGATQNAAAAGGKETLRVGAAPIVHFYTARIAEERGFFDEEGLNVELTDVTSATQQIALMESGSLDIGGSGPAELMTAAAQGLPVKLLPFADLSSEDPAKALRGIVVDPASGINDVSQLSGKTIAVSNLLSSPHLDALGAIDALGGDASSVTFVAIPSGQQRESLKSGEIQAAVMFDPSKSAAIASGAKVLANPEASGNLLAFSWFVNDDFMAKRPDDAAAFVRAMDRAAELIEGDPSILRDMAVQQGLDPTVAEAMSLPTYATELASEDQIGRAHV